MAPIYILRIRNTKPTSLPAMAEQRQRNEWNYVWRQFSVHSLIKNGCHDVLRDITNQLSIEWLALLPFPETIDSTTKYLPCAYLNTQHTRTYRWLTSEQRLQIVIYYSNKSASCVECEKKSMLLRVTACFGGSIGRWAHKRDNGNTCMSWCCPPNVFFRLSACYGETIEK